MAPATILFPSGDTARRTSGLFDESLLEPMTAPVDEFQMPSEPSAAHETTVRSSGPNCAALMATPGAAPFHARSIAPFAALQTLIFPSLPDVRMRVPP